jgi:lysyl-tRNA synthetase class II
MRRLFHTLMLLSAVPVGAAAQSVSDRLNDFPTAARADYVFACMAANGQSREILDRCACSIDEIASILTYETYLEAETVLSMRRVGGERMSFFVSSAMAENIVADLRRAQAEAEIVCF